MNEIIANFYSVFLKNKFSKKGFAAFLVLLSVFLFAFYVRSNTFWLPHWQGDQSQYVALAMKIAKQGMRGYHLREVSIHVRRFPQYPGWKLIHPGLTPKGEEGDLFKIYKRLGFEYYNVPFYYKSPLFPATLALSHKLFTKGNHPFVVVQTNLGEEAAKLRPQIFFLSQAWAVIVPLGASMLTLLVIFFFANKIGGARAAIYASFSWAIHPISILTSQHLFTEDLMTLLAALSLFLFARFYEKKVKLGVWFAGCVGGYATLANQKAILLIFALWIYTVITNEIKFSDVKSLHKKFFNKYFLLYAFGMYFISAHWFYKVMTIYGNPFFQPSLMDQPDVTGWYFLVRNRPPAVILYTFGIAYLCPPFFAAFFSLKKFVKDGIECIQAKKQESNIVLLWSVIIVYVMYYQFFGRGLEHRYFLPAYPAYAILAGLYLEKFRCWINSRFVQRFYGDIVLVVIFGAAIAWAVPLALDTIFDERLLIISGYEKFWR